MLQYFNISIPAPHRLAMMRDAFKSHAVKYPHCPESAKPASWRGIRGTTLGSFRAYHGALSQGSNGKTPVWYSQAGPEFRGERFADDCEGGPRHTGWFTDDECSDKARGIVARLPHGRFLAGYHWSSNDERVYFPEIFDSERDAARMADSHAESFADDAREDNARFNAMQDAESAADDAREAARLAIMARNVSSEHREIASESIAALREALETLSDATRAYERG